ncbi:MAG: hypothetical protein ABII26_09000 [Pseudomonadota bacterium]
MTNTPSREELIEQLRERIGEVAEHRAIKWLEELEKKSPRTIREELFQRLQEVPVDLDIKWLKELDERLSWVEYRDKNADFCYGVGWGESEGCKPSEDHDACPIYDICKAEKEAEWPEKKISRNTFERENGLCLDL